MAREMKDEGFAKRVRGVFERGSRHSTERLWNGEYFVQLVDLHKHPEHQYGKGCLSDQLLGQGWAHQLNLGYLYPQSLVRETLQSIWRYNWAPDVGPYNASHRPRRVFADPGEAGLFSCTWPNSQYLDKGVLYRNEVWTGTEYQVAAHMIWEDMIPEALTVVRGVCDRYYPLKRNPFNEVECGDHYARALASWGVFTALSGYQYHGSQKHLGFSPKLTPERFRCAFTTAEGWGVFQQERDGQTQRDQIELRWGRLRLKTLAFSVPDNCGPGVVCVSAAGQFVRASFTADKGRVTVILEDEILLQQGDVLDVTIR
jgi:hypothetical protein